MTSNIVCLSIFLLVLPQWFLMIAKPQSKLTQLLVDSDFIPFIMVLIYVICLAQNDTAVVNLDSWDSILELLQIESWQTIIFAYLGFMSLLIGGWVFNLMHTKKITTETPCSNPSTLIDRSPSLSAKEQ